MKSDNCIQRVEELLTSRQDICNSLLFCRNVASAYPENVSKTADRIGSLIRTHALVLAAARAEYDQLVTKAQKQKAASKAYVTSKSDPRQITIESFVTPKKKSQAAGSPLSSAKAKRSAANSTATLTSPAGDNALSDDEIEVFQTPVGKTSGGKSIYKNDEAENADAGASDSDNSSVALSHHSSDEEAVVNKPKSQEDSQLHARYRAAQLGFKEVGVSDEQALLSIPVSYCKEGHRVIQPFKVPSANAKSREKLRCAGCQQILHKDQSVFNCRCDNYFVCEQCIRQGLSHPPPPNCIECQNPCQKKSAHGIRECQMLLCQQPNIATRAMAWYCSNKDCDFVACVKCLKISVESSSIPTSKTIVCSEPKSLTAATPASAPHSRAPSSPAGNRGLGRHE